MFEAKPTTLFEIPPPKFSTDLDQSGGLSSWQVGNQLFFSVFSSLSAIVRRNRPLRRNHYNLPPHRRQSLCVEYQIGYQYIKPGRSGGVVQFRLAVTENTPSEDPQLRSALHNEGRAGSGCGGSGKWCQENLVFFTICRRVL